MALERKHIILIASAVLAAAIGVTLYFVLRKPKDEQPEDTAQEAGDSPTPANASTSNQSGVQDNKVVPIFGGENELKNPLSQLIGRVLYPKRTYLGGWDYTNVRLSAEVNNESAWYDPYSNLLTTINAGTPIGKVISETTGVYNEHPYRWFKVALIKSVWGYTEGFVRADTVTFQSYSI